jgi:hypothetical protein
MIGCRAPDQGVAVQACEDFGDSSPDTDTAVTA